MKLMGRTIDGGLIVEIAPKEMMQVDEALRDALLMIGSLRLEATVDAAETQGDKPTRQATAAAVPSRTTRRPRAVQDRKPAARAPAGGEIYHRCEQCDEKLPASAAPQKRFCDACVRSRKNACPSMQKRKAAVHAPAAEGENGREIKRSGGKAKPNLGMRTCEGCGEKYQAVRKDQRNCSKACNKKTQDRCRKQGTAATQGTAAAQAPALQKPAAADIRKTVAVRRPVMPSDDAGKQARLEAIRRVALRDARELEADVIDGVPA